MMDSEKDSRFTLEDAKAAKAGEESPWKNLLCVLFIGPPLLALNILWLLGKLAVCIIAAVIQTVAVFWHCFLLGREK